MKTLQHPLRAVFTALVVLGLTAVVGERVRAEPDDNDDPDSEILTRGPVHEAFAAVVAYNPEPGVIVPKTPPEPIEEVPPDEKPEGENVAWIPGYWAWDDERNEFLWISGLWRALPPGRQWVAGYWAQAANGQQWISGYWADARAEQTTYLPQPPATLERGPSVAAPSPDYFWTPGYWLWYDGRYAWRPGYWVNARPDWDWCPPYYSWTPRGYVFVDGYWDYLVVRRGVLFAPVYFHPRAYVRHRHYSPRIVIDLAIFPHHLFLRPRYRHYYFGDYYAPRYHRTGFYTSFSFQSRRRGYDPIYNRQRWDHRHDRDWERRFAASYQHRRANVDARPPRTWAAQRNLSPATKDRNLTVATSFSQLATRQDAPQRFRSVPAAEKQRIVQRGQEVQQAREQRRSVETAPRDMPTVAPGRPLQPATGRLTPSPIKAPPVDQPGRVPAAPTPPVTPRPPTNVNPRRDPPATVPDRRPSVEQAPRRETPATTQPPPVRRESPAAQPRPSSPPPFRRESPPAVQPLPSRPEPPPASEPPARRETPPAMQPQPTPSRPESAPSSPPSRRESPPQSRRESPQPARPQPTPPPVLQREAAQAPARQEPPTMQSQPARSQPVPSFQPQPSRGGPPSSSQPAVRREAPAAPPPTSRRESSPPTREQRRDRDGEEAEINR